MKILREEVASYKSKLTLMSNNLRRQASDIASRESQLENMQAQLNEKGQELKELKAKLSSGQV